MSHKELILVIRCPVVPHPMLAGDYLHYLMKESGILNLGTLIYIYGHGGIREPSAKLVRLFYLPPVTVDFYSLWIVHYLNMATAKPINAQIRLSIFLLWTP